MKKIYFVFLFVVVCSLPLISVAGRLQDAQKSVISARGSSSSSSSSSSSGCPACSNDINVAGFGDLTGFTQDYGSWNLNYGTAYNATAWTDTFLRYSSTTVTAGECQWALTQIGDTYGIGSDSNAGVFLQATGSTGYRDVVRYNNTDDQVEWAVFNADSQDELVDYESVTLSDGDVIAAQRVSGGYSVWINPSGSCPDNWGAATYSLTGTPTHTASGTYTGLFESHGSSITYFDTFYAGD